ncbi:PDR/VanB family oxidoreductase [Aquabacter sp. CN5-332]|uniref:PDR/VanB family oxidoreductase n=1 Tax=Aquabacter sp. CN5-332 TaxID=3156608 RepID=UPI0032B3E287
MRAIRTRVAEAAAAGTGVKRFVLEDPDGWELPPFRPGGHVDLHLPDGSLRTYSLCNDPAEQTRYVVAVKREADGRGGSILLHDTVTAGMEIGVSLPRGGVPLAAGRHVFVAGGIGVTPFLSAAASLQREGRGDFELHVISRGPPPLAAELEPFLRSGHARLYDTTTARRPDLSALLGAATTGTALSCCGPLALTEAFEQATRDWAPEAVHVERFVAPELPPDPDARPYRLVLARSGREMDVGPAVSVLDALLHAGIEIPHSCCGGICGACRVDWLEGRPVHRDRVLSPAERQHALMACVAFSAEDRLVLDL